MTDRSDLPLDAKALFHRAELRAEALVAVLRMVMAVGLAVVFALAIWSADPDVTPAMERQWIYAAGTMISYFALGLASLLAYWRGWLRVWMIWPAATADVLFFLASLWLGMANMGLPGGHAFVFPSVWLGPMVLAFGVLRFNPAVQAHIAVLTVLGLLLLSSLPPPEGFVPRSGLAAVFMAPPANAMRVVMLALTGAVLVVAAIRTRRLLLRSITEAQHAANLTRYLPGQLAARLAEGGLDELRRGRWQPMGVLFIDLRGFTRLSQQMTPQELSDFATEYRRRVTGAAQATGGIIDKFMGDAAMIVFEGADDPAGAARACIDCALRLNAAIADWSRARQAAGKPEVRAGIGLHWGEVFSGVVGTSDRLEFSVFGDTVNTAARLEEMTKTLGAAMVASCDILQAAGDEDERAAWPLQAEISLRGRDGVLRVRGHRGV